MEAILEFFQMSIREGIALSSMLIVFIMSLVTYKKEHKFLFISWDDDLTLAPKLASMVFAVVLMASLQIRGYLPMGTMLNRFYYIAIWLLDIWLIATLIDVFIDDNNIFSPNILKQLLLAIFFAYMGMRAIACYTWLGVSLLAIKNMIKKSEIMGKSGAFFILLIFLSFSIQAIDPIFTNAFSRIGDDFGNGISQINDSVKPVK